MDQQQQQHQILMKYIEGIFNDKSTTTSNVEGLSSNSKSKQKMEEKDTTNDNSCDELKKKGKEEQEQNVNRSKFKKVGMPVFNGSDPDSWIFKADRYFQIHKLSKSEKMAISVISFDGPALN